MFERFTDRARKVVSLALAKAKEQGDDQIRPAHMLYGVTAADGVGARALTALGVDTAAVERELGRLGGTSPGPLGAAEESADGDAEALAAIGIDLDEIKRTIEESFGPGALERVPHPGGVHGVDPDPVSCEFVGHGPGDADHAVLGGHVRGQERQALDSGRGAGGDDRAAARRDEVRGGGHHGVPHPGQVGIQRVLPDGRGDLVPRLDGADTGVGADDIQPPQLSHAVVHGGLQRGEIAHVRLRSDDPAVQRLDRLDRLGQVGFGGQRVGHDVDLAADVHRDDVRALLGQPDRVTAALPAGRSGDERDLALNSSGHGRSPYLLLVYPASTGSVTPVT
jgi:hypothetical protein